MVIRGWTVQHLEVVYVCTMCVASLICKRVYPFKVKYMASVLKKAAGLYYKVRKLYVFIPVSIATY